MENKRNQEIDIVKGMGIIFMVLGHSNFPLSKYISLFHMAIFFIASGYLYKSEYSENLQGIKKFIIRKLKTLWLPYFAFNTLFILMNNFFIDINIYTDNPLLLESQTENIAGLSQRLNAGEMLIDILKSFFFLGGTQLGGTFWFLRALFVASVMVCIIEFILKKFVRKNRVKAYEAVIAVILLIGGYFLTKSGLYVRNIPVFFTVYFFMISGRVIKDIKKTDNANNIISMAVIIVTAIILTIAGKFTFVDLSRNSYTGILPLIVVSYAGWFMLYFFAKLISKLKIRQIFVVCGRNTLSIMIWHFLCFKLVSLIQIIIYNKPQFMLASFPVLISSNGWWLAYAVCGLVIPIAFNEVRKHLLLQSH